MDKMGAFNPQQLRQAMGPGATQQTQTPQALQPTTAGQEAQTAGLMPQQIKPSETKAPATVNAPNDSATLSEEEESRAATDVEQQTTARLLQTGRDTVPNLRQQAQRRGDTVAERAFQDLQEREPDAELSRSPLPQGFQSDATNPSFRTQAGYFLELQNREESEVLSQGYRLFRPMEDDPETAAELMERQFDESGELAYSLDQKTLPTPRGRLQRSRQRYHDGKAYRGMVSEEETIFDATPDDMPAQLKGFPGYEKFMELLEGGVSATLTRIEQQTLSDEEAVPEKEEGVFMAPKGRKTSTDPSTGGILLNLASQGPLRQLPQDGALYLLTARHGAELEVFLPRGGRRKLAIRTDEESVLYWEEEGEETDDYGQTVRRRVSSDRQGLSQRSLTTWSMGSQLMRLLETLHRYANVADVGVEGREIHAKKRLLRRLPGNTEQVVDESTSLEGGRRRLQRFRDRQLIYVEESETTVRGEETRTTTRRSDLKRGREGRDETVSGKYARTRHTTWHSGPTLYIDMSIESTRMGAERHTVVRYSQPSRQANGEVVAHYDDRVGRAARVVRRQIHGHHTAADLVGAEGHKMMAGNREDPDCLELEPSLHVGMRWETMEYEPLTLPAAGDLTVEVPAMDFDQPECPQWMLLEDFHLVETRGRVTGPRNFLDRVIIRRFPGPGGVLQRYLDVTSVLRQPNDIRDLLRSVVHLDGRQLGEAQARTTVVAVEEVRERLQTDTGLALLNHLVGPRPEVALEVVHMTHPPSGDRLGMHIFRLLDRPAVAIGRVQRATQPHPWWIRNVVPQLASFQAFLPQTGNTSWAINSTGANQSEVQIGVELPDTRVPMTANLWESTLESCSLEDVERVLKAHGLKAWDDLMQENPSVERFDWRIQRRSDLILLVRSLQGTRQGQAFSGERVVIKTLEGDLMVLLNGDFLSRSFGYMRGREGNEHFTTPHPAGEQMLILASDEDGVFGQLMTPDWRSSSLGRLGDAFGGLLGWLETGKPLSKTGSEIPPGYSERVSDLVTAVRGVARFPGPDTASVKAVLWDFSHMAWSEPDHLSVKGDPYIAQLVAAGHTPLEAACLLLLGEGPDLKVGTGRYADLRIVL
jgi:hypothetical protein